MMMLAFPDDPALPVAIARVAIAHGHHELVLKRTVKTLKKWELAYADAELKRTGAAKLRKMIRRAAMERLGDGVAFARLRQLLDQSETATDRRNDLLHGWWAQELDGDMQHLGDGGWTMPTVAALEDLVERLSAIAQELNQARLDGWLSEALAAVDEPYRPPLSEEVNRLS
jgi:hypothetical protein